MYQNRRQSYSVHHRLDIYSHVWSDHRLGTLCHGGPYQDLSAPENPDPRVNGYMNPFTIISEQITTSGFFSSRLFWFIVSLSFTFLDKKKFNEKF